MKKTSDTTANLSKLNNAELEEFLQRQKKILNNSKIVEKLSDKGGKVRVKVLAAETEISLRAGALDEAASQLELMTLGESTECVDSMNCVPKFCSKFEKYEEHRDSREKFKPFSTLKHSIEIKPANAIKWELFPNLKAEPPVKQLPELSLQESLEIAARQQKILRNLHLEDARKFVQETVNKTSFLTPSENFGGFGDYRDTGAFDDEDDSPLKEKVTYFGTPCEDLD